METVAEGNELVKGEVVQIARRSDAWTAEQVDLIKRTIAKGATDDELKLFLYTAKRMGLDPLARQIHAVKRWDRGTGREAMAIQVGIDGFRLVADRTEKYAPGEECKLVLEADGKTPVSATAYVKKLVAGTWHTVSATAYFDEYVQRTKEGKPNHMWQRMPKNQLSKCAEALALRKAFPAELSGVYTPDEMGQADNPAPVEAEAAPAPANGLATEGQKNLLWATIMEKYPKATKAERLNHLNEWARNVLDIDDPASIPADKIDTLIAAIRKEGE